MDRKIMAHTHLLENTEDTPDNMYFHELAKIRALKKKYVCSEARHALSCLIARMFNEKATGKIKYAYNSMIDLCALMRLPEEGEDWFRNMIENKISPDMCTYTSLIKGWANVGNAEKCEAWFKEMPVWFEPDVLIFNLLIKGWAWTGKHKRCTAWLEKMKDRGIQANNFTLYEMGKAYLIHGNDDAAKSYFNLLPHGNFFDLRDHTLSVHAKEMVKKRELDLEKLTIGRKFINFKRSEGDIEIVLYKVDRRKADDHRVPNDRRISSDHRKFLELIVDTAEKVVVTMYDISVPG
jgi:pentatricopeptide repeat protein